MFEKYFLHSNLISIMARAIRFGEFNQQDVKKKLRLYKSLLILNKKLLRCQEISGGLQSNSQLYQQYDELKKDSESAINKTISMKK